MRVLEAKFINCSLFVNSLADRAMEDSVQIVPRTQVSGHGGRRPESSYDSLLTHAPGQLQPPGGGQLFLNLTEALTGLAVALRSRKQNI